MGIFCFLSGCHDYTKIDELRMVTCVGADRQDGGWTVALETVRAGSGGDAPARILYAEGGTLPDALANGGAELSGRLYFSHCPALVVGEDTARAGLSELLRTVLGGGDFQITTPLYVAKGMTAAALVGLSAPDGEPLGLELAGLTARGTDAGRNPAQDGAARLYAAARQPGGGTLAALAVSERDGALLPRRCGTALFNGDRLVGFLDDGETDTLSILLGKADGVRLPCPRGTVLVRGGSARIAVLPGETPLALELTLTLRAALTAPQGEAQDAQADVEAVVQGRAAALLEKLQREFSCDALNLYDHAVHRSPAWDAACAECWAELYPTLRIAVESRVQLESTGRTTHDF